MSAFEAIGRATSEVGVFHATDYGAVFDGIGGTDNTDAINAALSAAAAYNPGSSSIHGAVVQLPPGNAKLTGQLVVSNGVWLRGCGIGATELYTNTNLDLPLILVDSTNQACKVSDFSLYMGNGTTNAHGIEVQSGVAWAGEIGGIVTEIEHVLVKAAGYGILLAGVENRLRDVYAARCGLAGFRITGTDSFLANCTADTCGQTSTTEGFAVASSNCKFANCKAFGCTGSGFNVGSGQRNMFSSCEAQDNGLYGFNDGGDNMYAACIADTNGQGAGTSYGFHLSGGSTAAGCIAMNRYGSSQDYSFKGAINNSVYPAFTGCTSRLPGVAHVDPASVGNHDINNLRGQQSVSYASPLTPDPYLGGSLIVGTLTDTLTVNAVASAGLFSGMEIGFQFTQDGTGHAVTFDSQYKTAAAISTTPSAVTNIQFRYDGTNFREIGRAVT